MSILTDDKTEVTNYTGKQLGVCLCATRGGCPNPVYGLQGIVKMCCLCVQAMYDGSEAYLLYMLCSRETENMLITFF